MTPYNSCHNQHPPSVNWEAFRLVIDWSENAQLGNSIELAEHDTVEHTSVRRIYILQTLHLLNWSVRGVAWLIELALALEISSSISKGPSAIATVPIPL